MFNFFLVAGRASLFACVVTAALMAEGVQAAGSQQQFPFVPPAFGASANGYAPQSTCFTGQFPGGATLGLTGALVAGGMSDGFTGPISGGPLVWSPSASTPFGASLDQVPGGRQIAMPGYVANDAMYAHVAQSLNLTPDRVRDALRQAASGVSAPTGRTGDMVAGVRIDDSRIAQALGVTTERWRDASQRAMVARGGDTAAWAQSGMISLDDLATRLGTAVGVSADRVRTALQQPNLFAGQSLFDEEVNMRLAQALGVSADRLREAIRQQVPSQSNDPLVAGTSLAGSWGAGAAGQYLGGALTFDPAQCSPTSPSQFGGFPAGVPQFGGYLGGPSPWGSAPLPYVSQSAPRAWPSQSLAPYPWSPVVR